jgi:hypothetical protein
MDRTLKTALISLLFNMAFGVYHIVFGIISKSWWLLTVGVYYLILSIVRFAVLMIRRDKIIIAKFVGIMLMLLSIPLAGTVILAFMKDRGTVFGEIVMITIALYAFSKITLATVNMIRSRKSTSSRLVALRNISLADAFVSMFSLQRSMLVSFGEMSGGTIRAMNLATGSGVCVAVFILGLNLVRKKASFGNLNKIKTR